MKQIYPATQTTQEITSVEAVGNINRLRSNDQPWILTNMITSADGATAVDGLSGGLGGPADHEMFHEFRAISDAIIVGSSTAVQENYGPPEIKSEQATAARESRGQKSTPTVVVVTARLSIDPTHRLFSDPDKRPIIATVADAPSEKRKALEEVADVIECGSEQVDMALMIKKLHEKKLSILLVEGGPTLNAQLIADNLIDEWNLTVSPILAAGDSKRAAQGINPPQEPDSIKLSQVWLADELLFCRWVKA